MYVVYDAGVTQLFAWSVGESGVWWVEYKKKKPNLKKQGYRRGTSPISESHGFTH
jgi:hypothetical protein